MDTSKSEEKKRFKELRELSTQEAIFYTLPNAGMNAMFGIIVNMILLYYINIMGQPPLFMGTFFSVALVLYAILCPLGGAISDKIHSRFGRKKTVMIITGPLYGLFFLLLWYPPYPPKSSAYGSIFLPILLWYMILLLLFRFVGSFFFSSYSSLLPELSTDEQNRIKISMINMILIILGTAIGMVGPLILLGETTQGLSRTDPKLYYPFSEIGQNIASGISIFSLIIFFFYLICIFLMLFFVKEPEKELKLQPNIKTVLQDLIEPFKDRNYRNYLVSYFFLWISLASINFTIMNLLTFLLEFRGSEYLLFAIVALSAAVGSFLLWTNLSNKLGLKKTTSICIIISIVSFIMVALLTLPMSHLARMIFGFLIICICLTGYIGSMIFPPTILSDIIDSAELRAGRSLSGSYTGAFNFNSSIAGACSMFLISVLLELFGPQASISYALIYLFGAFLLVLSYLIFQRVKIVGTENRNTVQKEQNIQSE
ncbi:MAG: MFS transporter [Promethearchaeia archaeon]